MPFRTLTLSDAFGSRWGTTGITGSLNPSMVDGVANVGASIGAGPPFGVITTTTSWGFDAGLAPQGAMSLIVTANGMTRERAQTFTGGIGSFASADAELSITIEEFESRVDELPQAGGGGTVHLNRDDIDIARFETGRLTRVRSVTSAPTSFIHIWSVGLGLQIHERSAPFAPVLVMPIRTARFYRCWFNAVQSATCQAVTGPAGANCNFAFGMTSAFFAFS